MIIFIIYLFIYLFFRIRKMTTPYAKLWRCTKRTKTLNCPATVIQDGDNYKLGLKNHIHPAEPGIHIAIKVKTEVSEV